MSTPNQSDPMQTPERGPKGQNSRDMPQASNLLRQTQDSLRPIVTVAKENTTSESDVESGAEIEALMQEVHEKGRGVGETHMQSDFPTDDIKLQGSPDGFTDFCEKRLNPKQAKILCETSFPLLKDDAMWHGDNKLRISGYLVQNLWYKSKCNSMLSGTLNPRIEVDEMYTETKRGGLLSLWKKSEETKVRKVERDLLMSDVTGNPSDSGKSAMLQYSISAGDVSHEFYDSFKRMGNMLTLKIFLPVALADKCFNSLRAHPEHIRPLFRKFFPVVFDTLENGKFRSVKLPPDLRLIILPPDAPPDKVRLGYAGNSFEYLDKECIVEMPGKKN